jgi:hypothetical protein
MTSTPPRNDANAGTSSMRTCFAERSSRTGRAADEALDSHGSVGSPEDRVGGFGVVAAPDHGTRRASWTLLPTQRSETRCDRSVFVSVRLCTAGDR